MINLLSLEFFFLVIIVRLCVVGLITISSFYILRTFVSQVIYVQLMGNVATTCDWVMFRTGVMDLGLGNRSVKGVYN